MYINLHEPKDRKMGCVANILSGDSVSGFGTRPGVTQALWPGKTQLSDFPVGASTTVQIRTEPNLTFGRISQDSNATSY